MFARRLVIHFISSYYLTVWGVEPDWAQPAVTHLTSLLESTGVQICLLICRLHVHHL